jgi:hypothetical protein
LRSDHLLAQLQLQLLRAGGGGEGRDARGACEALARTC